MTAANFFLRKDVPPSFISFFGLATILSPVIGLLSVSAMWLGKVDLCTSETFQFSFAMRNQCTRHRASFLRCVLCTPQSADCAWKKNSFLAVWAGPLKRMRVCSVKEAPKLSMIGLNWPWAATILFCWLY